MRHISVIQFRFKVSGEPLLAWDCGFSSLLPAAMTKGQSDSEAAANIALPKSWKFWILISRRGIHTSLVLRSTNVSAKTKHMFNYP